jgi:hypothetical protein
MLKRQLEYSLKFLVDSKPVLTTPLFSELRVSTALVETENS